MAALTTYTLTDYQNGDFTVLFTFDDDTSLTDTIAWGVLADDPPDQEGAQTAVQKLEARVWDYAATYLAQRAAGQSQEAPPPPADPCAPFLALLGRPQPLTSDPAPDPVPDPAPPEAEPAQPEDPTPDESGVV